VKKWPFGVKMLYHSPEELSTPWTIDFDRQWQGQSDSPKKSGLFVTVRQLMLETQHEF